jgi:hypothetical protein
MFAILNGKLRHASQSWREELTRDFCIIGPSWKSDLDREEVDPTDESNPESLEPKPDELTEAPARDPGAEPETVRKPILFFIHGNVSISLVKRMALLP